MPHDTSGIPCIDFINNPAPAGRSLLGVQQFRAVLTRLLRAEAEGVGASTSDLAALNDVLARATARRGLVATVRGYGWGWRRDPGKLLGQLFPAAWSAVSLLSSDDRHRLKLCDGCQLLFVDQSRNRSRRWCDMRDCGNREKQRRMKSAPR